jgi:uncharacterized protein (DUF983 family)
MPVIVTTDEHARRAVWPAIKKGIMCRCPHCGEGKLFRKFLKVVDTCPHCGEELHHHRADDAPPYIAMVIVGHLLIGIMVEMETFVHPEPWIYLVTLAPLAVLLPLAMLSSIKGAVVGIQWANYMHGFDPGFHESGDVEAPPGL